MKPCLLTALLFSSPGKASTRFRRAVILGLFVFQAEQPQSAEIAGAAPPFITGAHRQRVRRFFTSADGLPADEVRAVTVTREGLVLVAAGKSLAQWEGDRWVSKGGPSESHALFSPIQGPSALAGGAKVVWALNNGEWSPEEGSPSEVMSFASEPDGTAWALAPSGVWRRQNGWKLIHTIEDDVMAEPHSFLPGGSNILIAAETGLFAAAGKRQYWLKLEVRPGGLLSTRTRSLAWIDADHFVVATDKGFNISNGQLGWFSFTGSEGLPIPDLTHAVTGANGAIWLGSEKGLIEWKEGRWTYLAGKRWLPDNQVRAMATAPDGSIWVGTPKGLSHIFHRTLTLAEKAKTLQHDLESRDRRFGYVTIMHLKAPGVVEDASQEISDNDGLWTALYVAAESYRYAVTKEPEAKAQAWRSMQALLRLESITGISGFPARAICHTNEPQFISHSLRSNSEWHPSSVEKEWYWKGETSSDEIVGHYFAWHVFCELAADDEQKRQVSATCKRVTDHILEHNYYLVDQDGAPTTWGFWGPDRLNNDPKYWEERCLGSLEMLSHLKVAMRIVGDVRYENAYKDLIKNHHYALNTLIGKLPGAVSHDAQLLFLSYYPLLQLEKVPGLRTIYLDSIRRSWEMTRIEECPLWNFIYGASSGGSCDVEASVAALREIPLDFILWKTQNSHRADLAGFQSAPRKARSKPLPWTERIIHKWDHTPFVLDGGSDMGEGDQTIWLLPYWMGRYHKLIE